MKQESSTPVEISAEMTPNPNTIKFVVERELLESGSRNFPSLQTAQGSPLPEALFRIPAVAGVLIGTHFVTVTKTAGADWNLLAPEIIDGLRLFFKTSQNVVSDRSSQSSLNPAANEAEEKIRQILDEEIRPAVARDGGDIVFYGYENGVVKLHLQGSCSSCPSSVMTLKMGIETRLRQAIPEIKEVVQVNSLLT